MKVSVIIPTYNEGKNIKECLTSLGNQTYKDFEVIVVDDGSTDETLKIVKNFRISNLEFRILHGVHRGAGPARNLGVKKASGKILVFVDADMAFDRNFIKSLIKPILENKSKGTFSREEYVSNWDNIWAKCWNINSNLPPQKRLASNYPQKQKVFRAILKSEFASVGGFSVGGYTDDWTLAEKLGYQADAAKGAIFYHKNPESLNEVFFQAKWIGKRKYKLGIVGELYALARSSLPVSLVLGIIKAIIHNTPSFLVFKIIYDFGIFTGILELLLLGKTFK